ncbi:MAG: type VI secretion system contractile sheath large subunit [Legionellales bacterium]|nr:type VI secretion system contractile sheath large subunit [Legionellales bacterium]
METKMATLYDLLCHTAQITPYNQAIALNSFLQRDQLIHKSLAERLTAGIQILLQWIARDSYTIECMDNYLIDYYITRVDELISQQLDDILHHPQLQAVESLWRSLHYLVERQDPHANTKVEILDVTQQQLADDFAEVGDLTQSGLYQQIYTGEYDMPGGEPFAALVTPFQFTASHTDVTLLTQLAEISATAHCPLLANVGAEFFNKTDFEQVMQIENFNHYLERAEYIGWNAFRQLEAARYVGLALPRLLMRLPYDAQNYRGNFIYQEQVHGDTQHYLWGAASFAMAVNLLQSFFEYGWCVNIRGPDSGGKIDRLLLHHYDVGQGLQTKIPAEVLISETQELCLAELGLMPLSYYKNSDFACFFSANSLQKPQLFTTPEATANSRINAKLPYVLLTCRLAHYLKVLQREQIGSNISRTELEEQLNQWLQTLVTQMNNPSAELAAKHPLREGYVEVTASEDNPGFYRVNLYAKPHFQIEGLDVKLSLVAKLPNSKH